MTGQDSIIQQARDTLAKWREDGTRGPWNSRYIGGFADVEANGGRVALSVDLLDAPLIVGTAGNPDLLDALYSMLGAAETSAGEVGPAFMLYAERIAAAIVAAEERMQS